MHAVLQTKDLTTGDGLDQAVAAQCFAEGVTGFASVVADLVRSALDSAIVREAADRSPLRESSVATELADGTVHEGIMDLTYRDDEGRVVIVDYKTDAVPAALPARVDLFRPCRSDRTSDLRERAPVPRPQANGAAGSIRGTISSVFPGPRLQYPQYARPHARAPEHPSARCGRPIKEPGPAGDIEQTVDERTVNAHQDE